MAKTIAAATAKKRVAKKAVVKKTAGKKAVAKKTTAVPAKKTTSAKAAPKKKELTLKYEDKSKGQSPELVTIWKKIKTLMEPYEKGVMKSLGDKPGQFTLVNHKPFEVEGRKRNELWFASVLIQRGYVGFYFMPVYSNTELKAVFQPELLKCLKGKSCFHIRHNDPVLYGQIKDALKLGYEAYRKRGWI